MFDNIKILLGTDGSENSKKALIEASAIAKKCIGSIKVITVYKQGMEGKAEEIINEAKQMLENEKVEYTTKLILGSNPARALEHVASNEKFDLIVVGSRGLGSKASILLGSVSRQIVATANCNVLVVKQ